MPFPTLTEVQSGLDAYNAFLARVCQSKQDEIAVRVKTAGEEAVRKEHRILEAAVVELDLASAPRLVFTGALDRPGRMKASFQLPGTTRWSFRIKTRIDIGRLFSRDGVEVEISIDWLRVVAEIELDRSSPFEARFVDTAVKVELGGIKLHSSNFLLNLFADALDLLLVGLKSAIERVARDALAKVLPDEKGIRAIDKLDLASAPVRFESPPPDLTSYTQRARAVSARIAAQHTPWNTVLMTVAPRSQPDSPTGMADFEDSAIWTGHFLVAELFRHQVTRDADALANVSKMLDGLSSLIHLTNDPGLLSRVQVPVTDAAAVQSLETAAQAAGHAAGLFTSVDGRYRAIGQITRDQYAGAFLGAGMAAVLLEEGALRERARAIVRSMASYLVRTTFCPTEATVDPATGRKLTSTVYATDPLQVLAILQVAKAVDPGQFEREYETLHPMWSILWFFNWFDTLDPHSDYFKFNLGHSVSFLLLMLEQDATRHAQLVQSLQALHSPIRFHAQAWFNLVVLATCKGSELMRPRSDIEAETRHLIAQMFDRPPFILPSDLPGDPAVEKVVYPGVSDTGKGEIAKNVVTIPQRPATDFLWQRSPFTLQIVWKSVTSTADPVMRSPNVDIVLPYWLARKIGL
jgi:hypothetical protein